MVDVARACVDGQRIGGNVDHEAVDCSVEWRIAVLAMGVHSRGGDA
jgi:hypothetical protein